MSEPEYDLAAAVAAEIVNLFGGDYPGGKAILFGNVLFRVLAALHEIRQITISQFEPSKN